MIVIDDGSSDMTAEIARRAGAEVVLHGVNKGKGGALKTGFTAAVKLGADYCDNGLGRPAQSG